MADSRASQVCPSPGCPAIRPCAKHDRSDPRSARNHRGVPRQLRQHGADYDRAVAPLIGQPCALRLDAGCTGVATGGDFVIPVSRGGRLEDGLQPACSHCQSVQGGRMAAASRRVSA